MPQIVELPNHPYFIGVQFHPEYKSRPGKPSPLFLGNISHLYFVCVCVFSLCSLVSLKKGFVHTIWTLALAPPVHCPFKLKLFPVFYVHGLHATISLIRSVHRISNCLKFPGI